MMWMQPAWLWLLVPIAMVAAWTLIHPGRASVRVRYFFLWQETWASISASRRHVRKVSLRWVLLLAGAVLSAVAMAKPTWTTQTPRRTVTLAIAPSAELASREDWRRVRNTADDFLARLGQADRVNLVLPTVFGGARDTLTPSEARRRAAELAPVGIAIGQMDWPTAGGTHQEYWLVPRGAEVPGGERRIVVEFPFKLPAVLGKPPAVSTKPPADPGKLPADLDVFLTGSTEFGPNAPRDTTLVIRQPITGQILLSEPFPLPATGHWQRSTRILRPDGPIEVVLQAGKGNDDSQVLYREYLAPLPGEPAGVTLLGPDEPVLRDYIRAEPLLELSADPGDAQLIIYNGIAPDSSISDTKPMLVVHPPDPPPGWRWGAERQGVVLRDVQRSEDDILQGVTMEGVALRRVRGWVAGGRPTGQAVLNWNDEALLVKVESDPAGRGRRAVWVATDLSPEANTLSLYQPGEYITLLANITRWLLPEAAEPDQWGAIPPRETPARSDWRRVALAEPFGPQLVQSSEVLAPGLYKDARGRYHAVHSPDVSAQTATNANADDAAWAAPADWPLPNPAQAEHTQPLWSSLAMAAGLCWLTAWWLRPSWNTK